ncbi:putative ribonuclease H-like domain-containing protein [Tanacetum coccineum]|uniref:Ribonuclease H-like domain-containing protein n=1 Tax=Tanacetum coccineum TaxID=301880 RepID=A0ABQ5E4H4_9ASTR
MIEFCRLKGIKREYSNARTPQQNGVAERKNRTLIEAARTMLADSFLPNTFWAEAVSTACYVLNRPVTAENRANKTAGPEEANPNERCVLTIWSSYTSTTKSSEVMSGEKEANDAAEALRKEFSRSTEDLLLQAGATKATSTNQVSTNRPSISTDSSSVSTDSPRVSTDASHPDQDDSQIHALKDMYDSPSSGIFTKASYDDEGAMADFTNLESVMIVSPIPTSRIHTIHPTTQILGDPTSAVQTRSKVSKSSGFHAFVSYIQKQRRNNYKDFEHCLFACFLSQVEPKKISDALKDESWVDAMQEELLQFKIQKVWILVDLPKGNKTIGLKLVYRNKKDENGYRRGTIDKTLFIKKDKKDIILVQVYVDDIIFGSKKKSSCDEFEALMKNKFQMSSMGELTFFLGLQVKQKEEGIFISQDKYIAKILRKFDFMNVKTTSTPIETQRPLTKDEEATHVDVHLYRSMIGSLMYLTASRPDIMYLKGKPKLGLWYPRVSPFDLEAYSDSDYAGANLDRKSTTGGCQFLGRRLISWHCKKQTIMATSTTKAEYVAAASYCGQASFIRDAFEKKLIQVLKIHSDNNVVDLLTNAFDAGSPNPLLPTIIQSATITTLESCPKHNMIVLLEQTEGNTEFHEVIDFLKRSSIHYALTVSPVVSTTFIEQFWMTATSKTINNVRYINAKVVGKPITISEASIRSSLLFNDADGIESLPNQAIFDAIQQMGHLDAKKKFVMYPRFISILLGTQLKDVHVPVDQFPVNALTSKFFSFMVKKGKHFSRKVTPLFPSLLVQPTKDEVESSDRPSAPQPTPSPPHTSEAPDKPQPGLSPQPMPSPSHQTVDLHKPITDPTPRPTPTIPDSIPQDAGGNQSSNDRSLSGSEDGLTLQSLHDLYISLCKQVTGQAIEIKALKAQVKKLKRRARPVINHHKAWLRATRLKKRRGVFK